MMAESHPKEIIQKVREEVLCGKSKHRVAKELGIGITTVYRNTMDIPSHKHRRLSEEYIQNIREEVIQGKSKYQIAKEMGLDFGVVYYNTKDLPNHIYREEGIQGKTLELLRELLKNGYIISTMENTQRIRRIKRYLPIIQRAQVDGRSVYFLSDKNKVALQSMIKRKKSKIISYQELASISRVFGVNLSIVKKYCEDNGVKITKGFYNNLDNAIKKGLTKKQKRASIAGQYTVASKIVHGEIKPNSKDVQYVLYGIINIIQMLIK